jgi:uncharacterized protein with HEPN domain
MWSGTALSPSRHDPAGSLRHIVENAERVGRYMIGMDQSAFALNEAVRDAVERCIERVCDAAHRLGPDAGTLMPGQPWADSRGVGNRLRHAYDRIGTGIIWNITTLRLPELA